MIAVPGTFMDRKRSMMPPVMSWQTVTAVAALLRNAPRIKIPGTTYVTYLVPVLTAPPNRYTNTSRIIGGRVRPVIRASGLRTLSLRPRAVMASESDIEGLFLHNDSGRCDRPSCLGYGVAGDGEEHVVKGGAVHGEVADQVTGRVKPVKHRADVGRAAVGGHGHRERGPVSLPVAASASGELGVGGGTGRVQVQP